MDKHSEHFQPRGTTTAVVSPPLVGLLHQDLSVLCLFPASALALCISSLPAGPVASASSACSQRAFQPSGCHPSPPWLGSAGFTAGHHLQLLETRPALLTQEKLVPCVPALNGPLSLPWHCRTCFPEVVFQGGVAVNSSSNAGDNSGSLSHLQTLQNQR